MKNFLGNLGLAFLLSSCGNAPITSDRTEPSAAKTSVADNATETTKNDAAAKPNKPKPDKSLCPLKYKKFHMCASVSWANPPAAGKDSPFQLQFWNEKTLADESPAAELEVSLLMPDMGHGGRDTPRAKPTGVTGEYYVDTVIFNMTGKWEVNVQLKNKKLGKETATLKLEL